MEIAAKDVDYRCYRGDAINKRLSRRSPLCILVLRHDEQNMVLPGRRVKPGRNVTGLRCQSG